MFPSICNKCGKNCGKEEQPALYVFNGEDYCGKCLLEIAPYWKIQIDRACGENEQFKKRVRGGTYMVPREDVLGYGKKQKKDRYSHETP